MNTLRRAGFAALVAAFVMTMPVAASGLTVRSAGRSGSVVIGPNETIDDDLYVSGNVVEVRGTIRGTVFAAGADVTVEATVGGDVWAAGRSVSVDSDTSGTVHAAGSDVRVAGRVARDVTLAGSDIRLDPGLVVGGDAAMAGATLIDAGTVGRDLYAAGSQLTVSGTVTRDIRGDIDRLTLADGARVGGDVRYRSANDARVLPGATVAGRLVRSAPPAPRRASPAEVALFAFLGWIRRLVGLLVFGLIVVLLFPLFVARGADGIAREPLPSLGVGLGVLVLTPIVAMAVFLIGLLVGGWWIAFVLLALYAIAVAIATIVSSVFLGRAVLGGLHSARARDALALLIGLAIITVLEAIPVLGVLVRVAEVLFGLGAAVLAAAAAMRRGHAATPGQPARFMT